MYDTLKNIGGNLNKILFLHSGAEKGLTGREFLPIFQFFSLLKSKIHDNLYLF